MSSAERLGGGSMRWTSLIVALIAMAAIVLGGLQTGPFGRKQIVGLSPQQENQLGLQAFEQTLQKEGANVIEGGPVLLCVQRIASRLRKATTEPDVLARLKLKSQEFQWQVAVVRSKQANAFCLPGGKIVVYTGIFPVAETDAGLATVLGHEIGHALAHHGAERMAQQKLVALGTQAIAGSADLSPEQQRQLYAVLGAGAQFGIVLPFSRKHESEADHIGLLLMAGAGYDPEQASKFWDRMKELDRGARGSNFASTHPSHEKRSADLRKWVNEAIPLYEASKKAPNNKLPSVNQ